jgi:hypothetical protein
MNIFQSDLVENIILVTAIINIVLVLLIFFSCRFFPNIRAAQYLMNRHWYKKLYTYHSHLWWILMPSLIVHAFFAFAHKLSGG